MMEIEKWEYVAGIFFPEWWNGDYRQFIDFIKMYRTRK
jgi:hypothetical protein